MHSIDYPIDPTNSHECLFQNQEEENVNIHPQQNPLPLPIPLPIIPTQGVIQVPLLPVPQVEKAREERKLQKQRYREWMKQLDKDKYVTNELIKNFNDYFAKDGFLPIDNQSFGRLVETRKYFTKKKRRDHGAFEIVYTKILK